MPVTKNVAAPAEEADVDGDDTNAPAKKKPKVQKAARGELPEIIPQDPAPRQPIAPGTVTFKCISWNVAGLRALMEKQPEMLRKLVDAERPDVIALQEHKLQESHVQDLTKRLRELLPEYPTVRFACSTAKKGYSGVAVLCKSPLMGAGSSVAQRTEPKLAQRGIVSFFGGAQKKPAEPAPETPSEIQKESNPEPVQETPVSNAARLMRVTEGFHGYASGFVDEGRVLTCEFEGFFLVTAYVPNSGAKLERLGYRVREWDETFRGYLRFLDAKKPVVLGGDLNVCDLDIDIYNVDAPHVKKSAGLTPEERASFSEKLLGKTDPSGSAPGTFLLDAFRRYHPTASGWFTYWSGRVGNRPKNRGLRLDYFLCSRRMCSDRSEVPGTDPKGDVRLVDGFILDRITVGASDHAPLGVTLATPPP